MATTPKDQEPKKLNLEKLGDFFPASDIEWRAQRTGYNANKKKPWILVMPYISNRGVMARLDEVCGPAGWRNEYKDAPGKDKGVLCGISILIDGEWVTKWDGADQTSMEAVKGGLSNSMKRAAVQWGIGRYLYMMETVYAEIKTSGQHYAMHKDPQTKKLIWSGYWDDPALPDWATPGTKAEPPKNFKWKDPEGYEVTSPELEEERRKEKLAEQNQELKQKMATADRTPVTPPSEKPTEQVTPSDPRIVEFQTLMHNKVREEVREVFVDAVIGVPRPKTMGQIEMLIMMLKKRPDLPKTEDVVLDDIDDAPVTDADIDAAMQEAMNRDKSA